MDEPRPTGVAVDGAVDGPIPTSGTVGEPRPTSTAVEEPIPTSGGNLKRQAEDDGEGEERAHVYRRLEESRKREREGEGEPRNVKPALHIQAKEGWLEEMYDVVEVFSPPRVCDLTRDSGMRGGWSLDDNLPDPVTGRVWELRRPAEMRQVRRMWGGCAVMPHCEYAVHEVLATTKPWESRDEGGVH